MAIIVLPRIAGARPTASDLVRNADVKQGDEVIIDGRHMALNSESFAFQMAEDLSVVRPRIVVIVGGSQDWKRDIHKASDVFKLPVQDKSLAHS